MTVVLYKIPLLIHLNIRSTKSKLNGINIKLELIRHDLAPRFNIITVSETWLSNKDNVQDYLIDSFQTPFDSNRPANLFTTIILGS